MGTTAASLCALLWLAAPSGPPASAPSASGAKSAASQPINEHTRPELFREVPPDRTSIDTPGEPGLNDTGLSFWASFLFRTVAVLGIVVLLAYLTLHKGLGRLMKAQGGSATRSVKLVERLPLDQKHALFLVEVDGRRLLLGTGDNSTTLLAEVTPGSSQELASQVMGKENA